MAGMAGMEQQTDRGSEDMVSKVSKGEGDSEDRLTKVANREGGDELA